MKKTLAKIALLGVLLLPLGALSPKSVHADSLSVDFENPPYTTGTINTQDGWSSFGSAGSGCALYDHGVVPNTFGYGSFGSQSLRISNAVTSGCFGDQTFSKSLTDEAGETSAVNNGMSGGTRQLHFEAQFDLASTTPNTEQVGLAMSTSPDRGDGARMSYLRFEDKPDGIHVFFDDYQDIAPFGGSVGDSANGCGDEDDFFETDIGTLTRTPHAIKFSMDFVDGTRNDVVKIYIDGVLEHTGTSWEDYFRYCEGNQTRPVDSMLFRTGGTAAPATAGQGFVIDNLSLLSGPIVQPTVKVTIVKYLDGNEATAQSTNNFAFPMHAIFPGGEGDYTLSPTGFNNPNPYYATTSDMPDGSNYSTYENLSTICENNNPYALTGYSTGDNLSEAIANGSGENEPLTQTPSFTELNSDKYIIVWNETCPPAMLKVHILKYLDGQTATANSAGNYQFPMTATWQTANLNGGVSSSGNYVLGNNHGGSPDQYGADTSSMQAPADYTTSEITNGNSLVLPYNVPCQSGKYRLLGYKYSSTSFADASSQTLTTTAPNFTALNSDRYVLVLNETCPVITTYNPDICLAQPLVVPQGYTLRYGTSGSDTVTLAPNTMFVGKSGHDKVSGPDGNYIVCTGSGNDTISLGHGDSTIHAGSGNNTITVGNGSGNITTTSGNDTITVGNGAHTIKAGDGNNTISTGSGNQSVTTGNGKDIITTGSGNDTIIAGNGNNTVSAGDGDDSITAGSGNDTINGGPGTDTCSAGSGTNSVTNCP